MNSRGQSSDTPSERAFTTLKRRVYRVATLCGAVAASASILLDVISKRALTSNVVVMAALGTLALFVLWWLADAKRPLPPVERLVMLVNAFAAVALLSSSIAAHQRASDGYWLLLSLSTVLFIVFEFREAARWVLSLLLIGALAPPATLLLVHSDVSAHGAAQIVRDFLTCAAAASLTFALAWFKDRLLAERLDFERVRELAFTDVLTGVANRRRLYDAFATETTLADAGGPPPSLVLIDLDHFKSFNDTFGHNVGDRVLKETAALFRAHLPASALLGRWGGEEFVLLLPATTLDASVEWARQLRVRLAEHDFGLPMQVTASFGCAEYLPGEALHEWIGRADAGVYRVKRDGRDGVDAHARSAV
ncbi:GGDEF domain-containing protein [Deinococcus yavapaiensis]|uniref:Diguanylate cyclase (GGDEF)-like protein n=1 Tax=Deinococcus yavapaiensis KR-236 TaxID=694435 RepID=A0A318SQ12_9DEIO|nr:GGDEF domain-containing protein [Deinococcus yavapaiensis]PYE54923.1 diguanylate cyclase (GGDEF)-like protein [Deinococcus yavapaiensis KR-236]